MYPESKNIKDIVTAANRVLVIQADNPDADSLGSALALEHILGNQDKEVIMYCGVDIPSYIRYLPGWDRVTSEFPNEFDVSILVDASTLTLLEKIQSVPGYKQLSKKPFIVLDHHHTVENQIPYATVMLNDPNRAGAGELVFMLAKECDWQIDKDTGVNIMAAILGDTQGLTNELAGAETYRILAELIDLGVSRPLLEDQRREYGKMPPEIFKYKAELIKRTEYSSEGRVAHVTIPQNEITQFSPLYNPAPLVQNDMLQTLGVSVSVVFKSYSDGKVTAAIRTNNDSPVAADLAEKFNGGGHKNASGFKITDGRSLDQIRGECLKYADILLNKIDEMK